MAEARGHVEVPVQGQELVPGQGCNASPIRSTTAGALVVGHGYSALPIRLTIEGVLVQGQGPGCERSLIREGQGRL